MDRRALYGERANDPAILVGCDLEHWCIELVAISWGRTDAILASCVASNDSSCSDAVVG